MTRGLLKVHSSCKDGARHLHQMLVKSRYLSPKHKRIVDPVIHRNAYFAHPENLLLAMMTDYRRHIRGGPATGDEGQSCTSQWTNTEVQGSRETQLRRRGIFRHDPLDSLPYL